MIILVFSNPSGIWGALRGLSCSRGSMGVPSASRGIDSSSL
ncbi:hypothetical protein ACQ86N_33670 [Puia sp. P3]